MSFVELISAQVELKKVKDYMSDRAHRGTVFELVEETLQACIEDFDLEMKRRSKQKPNPSAIDERIKIIIDYAKFNSTELSLVLSSNGVIKDFNRRRNLYNSSSWDWIEGKHLTEILEWLDKKDLPYKITSGTNKYYFG